MGWVKKAVKNVGETISKIPIVGPVIGGSFQVLTAPIRAAAAIASGDNVFDTLGKAVVQVGTGIIAQTPGTLVASVALSNDKIREKASEFTFGLTDKLKNVNDFSLQTVGSGGTFRRAEALSAGRDLAALSAVAAAAALTGGAAAGSGLFGTSISTGQLAAAGITAKITSGGSVSASDILGLAGGALPNSPFGDGLGGFSSVPDQIADILGAIGGGRGVSAPPGSSSPQIESTGFASEPARDWVPVLTAAVSIGAILLSKGRLS